MAERGYIRGGDIVGERDDAMTREAYYRARGQTPPPMSAHRNGASSSASSSDGAGASSGNGAGAAVGPAEPERTCGVCGKPLDNRPGQARYCSKPCFDAARAARARADRAAAGTAATSQQPRRRARTQKPAGVQVEPAQPVDASLAAPVEPEPSPAPAGIDHQAGTLGILCEHAVVAVAARTIRGATFDTGDGISVTVAARW